MEETAMYAIAVALAKQDCWMNWESAEKRKLPWSEICGMEAHRLSFIIPATYDVLPSPINLQLWFGKGPSCPQQRSSTSWLVAGQALLKADTDGDTTRSSGV